MKTKTIAGIVISLCLISTLAACSFGGGSPNEILGMDQTAIAQTVVVLQTQLSAQLVPPQEPTTTISPSATAAPTQAPTTAVLPEVTQGPQYKAGPVTDITYIDNSVVQPGSAFVKTWRVQNSGTSAWAADFKVVFVSGDAMGGPASQSLGKTVSPGQSIDISISLIAPASQATFRGNWMLETSAGTRFGIGINADSPFWVQIITRPAFAVKSASPNGPATWSGTCPGSLPLTATITSDAAGMVTYYYVVNGGNTPTLSSTFSAAGTNTTTAHNYPVTASGSLSVQVYIDTPNHQLFPTVLTIPVTCTP
jgi:hypothetical protein